jgi:hypothetical protein
VNDPLVVYVAVFSLVALTSGALAAAWTRKRLGVAAAGLLVLWLVVWLADLLAISSGFRDADGFADCADDCTGVHYSAAVGFLASPLLVALAALAGLVALTRRWSARAVRDP